MHRLAGVSAAACGEVLAACSGVMWDSRPWLAPPWVGWRKEPPWVALHESACASDAVCDAALDYDSAATSSVTTRDKMSGAVLDS